MENIIKIANKFKLTIIEDCAHAIGAKYKGKKVGSLGDYGIFSFGFLKIKKTGLASDEFCTRLIDKTGVVCIPGISYGDDFDHYCRVSLVNHTEMVEEGLRRIGAFVDEMERSS